MAPIDINNQEISSITLNGSTEIDTVTVNGQEVFSAGPDIPASPTLRLKAESLTDSLNNGDTVSTWDDISGNSNDATANGTPQLQTNVLNGNAVVDYNGSEYHIAPNLYSGGESRTLAVVLNSERSGYGATAGQAGNNGTNNWFLIRATSDNTNDVNVFANDVDFNIVKSPPYYAMVTYDGSTVRTFKDGQEGNSSSLNLSTNNTGFYIAARERSGDNDSLLDGQIAEVLVYPRALNSSERASLIDYFQNEYGI